MVQFDEKIYFYAFAIIPIVLLLFFAVQFWKRRTQKKFANTGLLNKLAPSKSKFKPAFKLVVFLLAIACFVVALVNPKMGTKLETVKREGVDVVFAIDVSKSMLAEDIAPNRIEKAKRIVSEIMNKLVSDRVGIIAYAAQAYPQLPITTDYGAAKMFLQSMNTDMLSSQGTAINQAIELAKTYYNDDEQTNRVLFIISDGEDHSEEDLNAIEDAVDEGIKIYTIGVGTAKGNVIPMKDDRGRVMSYKKDQNGETVITRLDEETLKKIAEEGNGAYINGSDTEKTVKYVTDTLDGMDKTTFESKQYADFEDQFQWFLGAGILLLLIDVLMLERKTKWVQKLNLFNEKESEK
ncbi:Ca-activated chloride channel family protein [Pustulibacterium marinum]|uniref:Ca-activated chloride channel family protein n=1 Tax=Pustulibacterium marinum TaxID=1224947 RepID=A0A1I7HHU4_9FLAO|nr:VWA domain-containing protein [Pustulibacterium marinum]SFU60253.1 Ca-activated chloride channel family protein [Pustulibacterium marinum]